MNMALFKPILSGILIGALFFAIAPLGLGIHLLELLRPILAPGALIVGQLFGSNAGYEQLLVALVSNCFIYALIFSLISMAIKGRRTPR